MDIVRKEKMSDVDRAAEARHAERVRLGRQVLGLDPEDAAQPVTRLPRPVHHRHRPAPSRPAHMLRLAGAVALTVLTLVVGYGLFVGVTALTTVNRMNAAAVTPVSSSPTTEKIVVRTAEGAPVTAPPSRTRSSVAQAMSAGAALIGVADRAPLRGEADGRVNILLLGKGGGTHPGKDLTDTIMIASIDMTQRTVALLSLPRDLYVRIPGGNGSMSRINAIHAGGGESAIRTVITTVTGLVVHYVVVVDFNAFTSVVDALGGVNVTVERDIRDTRYPGPGYSYETFTLAKGLQHLDGATALKYVRMRHDDPEGDFGRAKRQQAVLQSLRNKAFSLGTLGNPRAIADLFDAVGAHTQTDMSLDDMVSLALLLPQLDTQNVTTTVIDAWRRDSLLRAARMGAASALLPRGGSDHYDEIHDVAATLFDRAARDRERAAIEREKPQVTIVGAGASGVTIARVRTLIADELAAGRVTVAATRYADRATAVTLVDGTDPAPLFSLNRLHILLGASVVPRDREIAGRDGVITVVLGTDADERFAVPDVTREQYERLRDTVVE